MAQENGLTGWSDLDMSEIVMKKGKEGARLLKEDDSIFLGLALTLCKEG